MGFQIDPWQLCRICDLGDVPFPETNDNEASIERITAFYKNIDRAGAGVQGFLMDEVMTLLRSVRGKNIIGGDIVCMMPTKDSPNAITAHTAAAEMFEIISLIADGLKT